MTPRSLLKAYAYRAVYSWPFVYLCVLFLLLALAANLHIGYQILPGYVGALLSFLWQTTVVLFTWYKSVVVYCYKTLLPLPSGAHDFLDEL
jgi:hypothetical protein